MRNSNKASGILVINKPSGMTSRDVVNIVCKKLNTKKVGHCGTLDPMATGVLIVCVNQATKLVNYLTTSYKTYQATMLLNQASPSLDTTTPVTTISNEIIDEAVIKEAFVNFPSKYEQEVPKFSAVKVQGKRLYKYARGDEAVLLPKRLVELKDLTVTKINGNEISFSVTVSKGTYIRSLIRDLALAMHSSAVMSQLERITQGLYTLDEALSLDAELDLIAIEDVKLDYEMLNLDEEQFIAVKNGRRILNTNHFDDIVLLYYSGKLIAIYESTGEYLNCRRGFYV